MTALIQGLEVNAYVLWKYIYFFTIEFLFLINDEGCYVSRDCSKFNPMNAIFFTFFHFAKGVTKGHHLTAERLLTMCHMNKRLDSVGEWFLKKHYSKISEDLKKVLACVKKSGNSAEDYLLEVKKGPIRDFKAHSQYLNKLKLGVIQRKKSTKNKK